MQSMDRSGAQCHDIRVRLQEIDPGYDIAFNYDTENYHITHNGHPFQQIHYQDVDRSLFEHIRFNQWLNTNGNVFAWVDEQNAKVDAARDKEESYIARCMAEDMYNPVKENYFYGR